MKKEMAAILLLIVTCSLTACGGRESVMDDQGALREYDPEDTSVYIDDEYTALVGSIEETGMTEAEKLRSAELMEIAKEAFDSANEQRVANGLNNYEWSDELATAAQVRAKEMVSLFSHTRPDGTAWWTVNSEIMYGENLAKGFKTAAACVSGWMNSPTHKDNILSSSFLTCGIAVYEDENGKLYFAQEFGF